MLSMRGDVSRMRSQISAYSYNFDVVKECIHLCTAINTNNDISLEIKRRVTLANRYYFGLNRQLSSRDLSRATKLTLYKVLILTVLLYGAEAWTLWCNDAAALGAFDRKVLRKIFGPVRVGDDYRIRTTGSCISFSMTWTLPSVCVVRMHKTLLRDECLMRWLLVIGGWDYRVRVGKTSLKRSWLRLVSPTGGGARKAETSRGKLQGRLKPDNRFVMAT